MELRPYQKKSLDLVYDSFRAGVKKIIVHLSTGAGKTFLYCKFAQEFEKFGHVVIIMRRRELIKQGSSALDSWDIHHGVYMANHHRFKPDEKVQVCSIDTLDARGIYPHEDKENTLIIIDESHDCTPRSSKYKKIFEKYEGNHIIGFTATPFSDNSMFEEIVNPIEPIELMEQGFLVPVKIFVPSIIDVSNVRVKRTGDFDNKELFEACSGRRVMGNIIRDWKQYGTGKRTIVFAVNIEHSKMICEEFNSNGIKAVHADAKTSSGDRDRILSDFRAGRVQVICNVNIFSTGLDVTEIECIQFARPTQSEIYYLQAIGRGLRPSPNINKSHCIIIDNAGNVIRHGTPYKTRKATLDRKSKSKDPQDITIRTCNKCHFVFEAKEKICPSCGFMNPPIKIGIEHIDSDMIEYVLSKEEIEAIKKKQFIKDFWTLEYVRKSRGLYKNFTKDKLKAKHGVDNCIQWGSLVDTKF